NTGRQPRITYSARNSAKAATAANTTSATAGPTQSSGASRVIAPATEEDVYRALDLAWIPPEMREDTGEIERAEREARREEQMLSRTERRAQEIAEALQLNNATAQELTAIMVEGAQAMTDVWGLVRTGEFDRREVRGLMTEQRDETNALVQQLLTPTQYETYTEMTETRGGGGGNFGWVGGRGGFGGPGGGNSSGGSSGGSNSSGAGNDTPPAGGGPGGGRGGV
ncbi:MAG: hypothetical protein ACO4CW_02570, partial [Planctomycetota bacterium]